MRYPLAACILGALFAVGSHANTIIASSCDRTAVLAAMESSSDGGTAGIPAGAPVWTAGRSWDAPAILTVWGAGDFSAAGGGDATIIIDLFAKLTARAEGGGVRLAFYLTTPVFETLASQSDSIVIQIHRKCVTNITWGQDYAEYFDMKLSHVSRLWRRTTAIWLYSSGTEQPLAGTPYPAWSAARPPYRCIAPVGTIHAGESGPELVIPGRAFWAGFLREEQALAGRHQVRLFHGQPPGVCVPKAGHTGIRFGMGRESRRTTFAYGPNYMF